MRVHVVHGILDSVGAAGLLKLVPYLQQAGFDCKVPDYGLITVADTLTVNGPIWRSLLPYMEPGDVYVGHSNGCTIGYRLMQAGAPFAGVVFINAALRRDIAIPAGMWADVYYNAGDDVTVASVASAAVGLSDPLWGDMGHAGCANPRARNTDCGLKTGLPPVSGHSAIFESPRIEAWGPYIAGRIRETCTCS